MANLAEFMIIRVFSHIPQTYRAIKIMIGIIKALKKKIGNGLENFIHQKCINDYNK